MPRTYRNPFRCKQSDNLPENEDAAKKKFKTRTAERTLARKRPIVTVFSHPFFGNMSSFYAEVDPSEPMKRPI
jgi:hypothetical protein